MSGGPTQPALNPPHTLREYALLADGERGILVGPRGDFAWMCFPAWDATALFSTLIGGSGHYSITPAETFVWGGYYEPGGLIWRSRWVTSDATVECREALALPSSPDRAVVLRRLMGIQGTAAIQVMLDPRAEWGRRPLAGLERDDAGVWRGQAGDVRIAWAGGAAASAAEDEDGAGCLAMTVDVTAGESQDFVLVIARSADGLEIPESDPAWRATERGWEDRVGSLDHAVAPRDARHAVAVLTGLTSRGGGMVAAATTSLPERASEGRNYDYRYVWIRDQCYAGQAAAAAGQWPLLDAAVRFAGDRLLSDGPHLKPAYTIRGDAVPDERSLDLPGYPGGDGVIGNRVNAQFQLDPFGEALLLFAAAARHDRLDADGWRAAEVAADAIAARWAEPDAGIWELDPTDWTHGRLIASAGLRAASSHAPSGELAAGWLALADRILAHTSAMATHPSGRWQRAAGDARVDAALLLAGIRGATAADDPRAVATLEAVLDELTEDGYVYRYQPDDRPLGEAEGAFLICGFWVALAFGRLGRHTPAARWFERTRAACGPAGLLAEEWDVQQRQLRGNIPQAFVHALLLECAVDQRLGWDGDG